MDLNVVIDTVEKVAREHDWSYPQVFDALKKYGVEKYETDVENHIIAYLGGGESAIKQPEGDFSELEVSTKFDEQALKKAIRTQQQENDYARFLHEIAAAGVTRYVVDMAKRTVTYIGNDGGEFSEKIPSAS